MIEQVEQGKKTVHAALKEAKTAKSVSDTSSSKSNKPSKAGKTKSKPTKPVDVTSTILSVSDDADFDIEWVQAILDKLPLPIDPVLKLALERLSPAPTDNKLFDAYTEMIGEMYDTGLSDDESRRLFRQWLKEEIVEYEYYDDACFPSDI